MTNVPNNSNGFLSPDTVALRWPKPQNCCLGGAQLAPNSKLAVTNARFGSAPRAVGRPRVPSTAPVPHRPPRARHERHFGAPHERRASVCGSASRVSLRLRSPALSPTADRSLGANHPQPPLMAFALAPAIEHSRQIMQPLIGREPAQPVQKLGQSLKFSADSARGLADV